MISLRPSGAPRPWTLQLSRQVSWLAGHRFRPAFPMLAGISDTGGRKLAAYSCGGSPGFA